MEIKCIFKGKELPVYKSELASGMDVRANIESPMLIGSLDRRLIPTGLFVEIPEGYEIQVRPRSGLAISNGVTVLNSPGTVDADYRGEIKVILVNLSREPFTVHPNDRIAQLVLAKVERAELKQVEELSSTERGTSGFGDSGIK